MITTRIAPANSRMMHALTSRQAPAAPALSLQIRGGRTMQFANQAEMMAAIQRMSVSAVGADLAPGQPEPAPAAPSTPADTTARLDAQDAQLQDHEARIAGLEQRSSPPAGSAEETQHAPPAASAVAAAPVTRMVNSAEIYGRMNARATGLKAAAPTPSAPAMIQTATGPILNARAIHDRHNVVAAARADRRR